MKPLSRLSRVLVAALALAVAILCVLPIPGHGQLGAWIMALPTETPSAVTPVDQIPAMRRIIEQRGFRPVADETPPALSAEGNFQPPPYVLPRGASDHVRLVLLIRPDDQSVGALLTYHDVSLLTRWRLTRLMHSLSQDFRPLQAEVFQSSRAARKAAPPRQ